MTQDFKVIESSYRQYEVVAPDRPVFVEVLFRGAENACNILVEQLTDIVFNAEQKLEQRLKNRIASHNYLCGKIRK